MYRKTHSVEKASTGGLGTYVLWMEGDDWTLHLNFISSPKQDLNRSPLPHCLSPSPGSKYLGVPLFWCSSVSHLCFLLAGLSLATLTALGVGGRQPSLDLPSGIFFFTLRQHLQKRHTLKPSFWFIPQPGLWLKSPRLFSVQEALTAVDRHVTPADWLHRRDSEGHDSGARGTSYSFAAATKITEVPQ